MHDAIEPFEEFILASEAGGLLVRLALFAQTNRLLFC